jgi:hypothetical protein
MSLQESRHRGAAIVGASAASVHIAPPGRDFSRQRNPRVSSAAADFTLGYYRVSLREKKGFKLSMGRMVETEEALDPDRKGD